MKLLSLALLEVSSMNCIHCGKKIAVVSIPHFGFKVIHVNFKAGEACHRQQRNESTRLRRAIRKAVTLALFLASSSLLAQDREQVIRPDKPSTAIVLHVQFEPVTRFGEVVPGGQFRDATIVVYFDREGPPLEMRGFTWWLVANMAPEGQKCNPEEPSILLLANATTSLDCPKETP